LSKTKYRLWLKNLINSLNAEFNSKTKKKLIDVNFNHLEFDVSYPGKNSKQTEPPLINNMDLFDKKDNYRSRICDVLNQKKISL
jgi:hypothetical protein